MRSTTTLSFTGLATLLAALSMLGAFSIDTYLLAFASIQTSLHASSIEVQQTLTAYMLSFAVMTLWHGALSDSFGRRNVVLVALIVLRLVHLVALPRIPCITFVGVPWMQGWPLVLGW